MRSLPTLLLVTALAVMSAGTITGTANAQNEAVEAIDETSGEHCGDVNCTWHTTGRAAYTQHTFGSESQASFCTEEFVIDLNEDATGTVTDYEPATESSCTWQACNGVGESAAEGSWPITDTGEYTGTHGQGRFSLRLCLDTKANPNGTGIHCDIEIDFNENTNHAYGFSATDQACPLFPGVSLEINSVWNTEDSNVEIIHEFAANEPIEAVEEATGDPCNESNCTWHMTGSSVITQHIHGSESQVSACTDEFVADLNADASGEITTYENDSAPECTRRNCNGTGEGFGESSWPITEAREYSGSTGHGHLAIRFCLDTKADPNGDGTHCTFEIDVAETTSHNYAFTTIDDACHLFIGISAELDGSWTTEDDNIELVHE